jgi:hypothetical protein
LLLTGAPCCSVTSFIQASPARGCVYVVGSRRYAITVKEQQTAESAAPGLQTRLRESEGELFMVNDLTVISYALEIWQLDSNGWRVFFTGSVGSVT